MDNFSRNLGLSVEYRLWQILCQEGWIIEQAAVPLTAVPNTPNAFGSPDLIHPWCFFDAQVQNGSRARVRVYRNGVVVDPATYVVDFKARQVTFAAKVTGSLTADVTTFAATVQEGYPEAEIIENIALPLIAYTLDGDSGTPFAIGTSAQEWTTPLTIDLLAADKPQRKDLADSLLTKILRLSLLESAGNDILGVGGDINAQFDAATQCRGFMRVANPRRMDLAPRKGGSDKEKHRAMISANLKNIR